MASYFEEMGWTPLEDGETPNHFLHMARLLRDFNMFEEMGMTQKLPPPASAEEVQKLPSIKIEVENEKCAVCLKEYTPDTDAVQMPCRHLFHRECILPWLAKTNSCPVCRFELKTDDEDYELYKKEKIRASEREKELESLHNSMFS